MSGRKTVSVDSYELERLRRAERELSTVQRNLPDVLNGIRREQTEALHNRLAPLEQRQQQFQNSIANLQGVVRQQAEETNRQLANQYRQLSGAIQSVNNALITESHRLQRHIDDVQVTLRAETLDLIYQQEQRFSNAIELERQRRQAQLNHLHQQLQEEQAKREQQIGAINQQLSQMATEQARKKALATDFIEAARAERDAVAHYRHTQFAPGELAGLEVTLRDAEQNLAHNAPEGALAQAQQAYRGLTDLHLRLERLELEWEFARGAALASVEELMALVQRNRTTKALNAKGVETSTEIEVNYWTDGKLEALEQDLATIRNQIEDITHLMPTSELQEITRQRVRYEERLQDILHQAITAVIGSQVRAEIADMVVTTLREQGFEVLDGTYEAEDMRSRFVAKVADRTNHEIVIEVNSADEQPLRPELVIHSYDVDGSDQTEHRARQRANAITEELRANGLQAPTLDPSTTPPDTELRDITKVRQGKTKSHRPRKISATPTV